MNRSISSLSLFNVFYAPLFVFTSLNYVQFFYLRNSVFGNFTKHAVFSESRQEISIERSLFKHFLDRAIYLNGEKFENSNIKHRVSTTETSLINNCYFIEMHSYDKKGSAIYSDNNIKVSKCYFYKCQSDEATVYSTSGVIFQSSTFRECTSRQKTGALSVINNKGLDCNMSLCVFSMCSSELFGSIYKQSSGWLYSKECNFSLSYASDCVGLIEVSSGPVNIINTLFDSNSALVHNGCCVFRNLKIFYVRQCAFINNSHMSDSDGTGSVMLFYNIPPLTIVKSSYFINNNRGSSFIIRVDESQESVKFIDTFFSNDKDEIKADRVPVFDNVIFKHNKTFVFSFANEPGYAKQDVNVDSLFLFNLLKNVITVSTSFTVTIVVCYLVIWISPYILQLSCVKHRIKTPQTFL